MEIWSTPSCVPPVAQPLAAVSRSRKPPSASAAWFQVIPGHAAMLFVAPNVNAWFEVVRFAVTCVPVVQVAPPSPERATAMVFVVLGQLAESRTLVRMTRIPSTDVTASPAARLLNRPNVDHCWAWLFVVV